MRGVTVVAVELIDLDEPVEVFDIQVEEDESFIVADVVAHNSAVCRARAGKVFPIGRGPVPPGHPRCRSTVAPVIAGEEIEEEGAYQDWLSRQSAAEQDAILGPTRGKLFRKGGLSVAEMVDIRGRPLTLDELRARDAEAFRKAGLAA